MQWDTNQPLQKENHVICNNMDELGDIILSEITQTQKAKYFTCRIT
jgi:hypothetical protein